MATAEQIRSARDALKQSQAEFAAHFGVDQTTVHRWETKGPPNRGPGAKLIDRVLAEIEKSGARS